jgi:hypothetical protein
MSGDQDERLAAWLDGALTEEEAAAFEAELQRDPALAARAASWKANDAFIAGAFAPLVDNRIDPALLRQLGLFVPTAANDNPPWWRRPSIALSGAAVAAGLALVLVLTGQPGSRATDPLSLALDTTPSLQQAKLADGRTIEPRLTVRAGDGRWCREFASAGTISLACRDKARWQVIGSGEAKGDHPAADGTVVLAGGPDGAALDAAYARIGAGDPVNGAEEAKLIAGNWPQN